MDGGVFALTVYGTHLIAGGYFTQANGIPVANVAAWDGSAWSALGSGIDGDVYALTVYDGQLIAGGYFTETGGAAAHNVAAWNGTAWSALGSGTDGAVYALTVYGGQLIAGGYFAAAGGVAASSIAGWNGSSWSALGSGIDGDVYGLTVYDNRLVAGGFFWTAGGAAANNSAAWDGSSWTSLGSGTHGVNSWVNTVTSYNGKLIAGGAFTIAGGKVSAFVATWDTDPTGIADERTPSSGFALSQNYPNPFNPTTTIEYSLAEPGRASLRIYNAVGQLVRTLIDEDQKPQAFGYTVRWDGRDDGGRSPSSGVYFYRLTSGDKSQTKKLVLVNRMPAGERRAGASRARSVRAEGSGHRVGNTFDGRIPCSRQDAGPLCAETPVAETVWASMAGAIRAAVVLAIEAPKVPISAALGPIAVEREAEVV